MVAKIRRVLTGHDKRGRSTFIEDRAAPNVMEMAGMKGLALTDLWESRGPLASNNGNDDAAKRKIRLEPPKGGSILRIVEFPPDSAWRGKTDGRESFKSIGAGHAKATDSSDPMMHTTSSVDYIIVLKGEIYAVLETGEKKLKAGDVLIQRGTKHSWSVRTKRPCIIAAVLVSAKPVRLPAKKKAIKRKAATTS